MKDPVAEIVAWDKKRQVFVSRALKAADKAKKNGRATSKRALSFSRQFRIPGLALFGPWGALLLLFTLLATMADE